MKRRLIAALCVSGLVLPLSAGAHAFLDHASPRVGSTVSASPDEVKLWFTQELEPAFSSVNVQDAAGKRVDKGDAKIAAGTMQVSLPKLAPGRYKVTWRALSVDTHVTDGDFIFEIAP